MNEREKLAVKAGQCPHCAGTEFGFDPAALPKTLTGNTDLVLLMYCKGCDYDFMVQYIAWDFFAAKKEESL